jgi:2-keto-4-pentenoate hydratase/2-oxohepta-3-ene-1,7-dioic acid hydratase in catechol pathway
MRICRFRITNGDGSIRLGIVEGDSVRDVTAVADELPNLRWPVPPGDQLIANLDKLRPRMEALAREAKPIARSDVRMLAPVANPSKIVCGNGNWKHFDIPFGAMGFIVKASSALAGEDEGVQIRWPDRETWHEPEMGVVIARQCENVSEEEALDYAAGYTAAFDMTLRQDREDWSFCKSFNTYGVLGPWMVTADEIPDPAASTYRFFVNDELRGEHPFSGLTGSLAKVVSFASSVATLYPGDVVLTGACDLGPVSPGDVMRLEIPEIGPFEVAVSLSPHARAAAPSPNA